MPLLLGIDIGTSSAKALLFDRETSRILAVASQEYPIHKPAPDRAEQDPDDWWRAAVSITRRILAQTDVAGDCIAGIGFSGQMHGTVLVDAAGTPLAPAIIWPDQRSGDQCDQLVETVGARTYAAITGTLPAAGFLGPSLLWLSQHAPELLAKAHRVILPKDYVRLKLIGEIATDVSDAAGTGIFNITSLDWAQDILARTTIPVDLLPPVLQSTDVAGRLTKAASDTLGIPAGVPVVAGCADQPAQAVGNGLVIPGRGAVTVGSGGQIFLPMTGASLPEQQEANGVRTDPRLHVFNHAVPGMWYVLGAILSAGLSLRWLRGITGLAREPDAYAKLSNEASTAPPGADGLLFLPYLSGERTPHMDPEARGAFVGLTHFHQRGHLARAVMEGVALALRQALEIGVQLSGEMEILVGAGGGLESPVWRQIIVDVFGLPVQRTLSVEQASLGAALLAGVGVGLYQDLQEACNEVVRYGPITSPIAHNQERYNALYERFTQLYPRLRDDFHWLSAWNEEGFTGLSTNPSGNADP